MGIYLIGDTFYSIVGVQKIEVKNIGEFLEQLRNVLRGVYIQALDANIVYGIEHIDEVLKITLQAMNRKITFANKAEIDLLLRLSYTNQISMAVKYGGLKMALLGASFFFPMIKQRSQKPNHISKKCFLV